MGLQIQLKSSPTESGLNQTQEDPLQESPLACLEDEKKWRTWLLVKFILWIVYPLCVYLPHLFTSKLAIEVRPMSEGSNLKALNRPITEFWETQSPFHSWGTTQCIWYWFFGGLVYVVPWSPSSMNQPNPYSCLMTDNTHLWISVV